MNDLTSKYKKGNSDMNPNLRYLLHEWSRWRILALQGGTRSGKTYSAIHFIIHIITTYTGITISVVRATRPSIAATVLRDFQDEMLRLNLWSDDNFNKSNLEYSFNGNLVEFFSVDDEQKVRGRKRHILFVNEANEIGRSKMLQLMFRTEGIVIMDFNPSMVTSYIYDDLLERDDASMIITNYQDNPFLTPEIINEIERLQITDPESWKIYGEGQRGSNRAGLVFPNWRKSADPFPAHLPVWYGVDFGFANDPTAIVRLAYDRGRNIIYAYEVAYQKGLQNADIARIIRQDMRTKESIIYEDERISVKFGGDIIYFNDDMFPLDAFVSDNNLFNVAIRELCGARAGGLIENGRVVTNDAEQVIRTVTRQLKDIAEGNVEVYCDSSEAKSIQDLRNMGISAMPCIKGDGSVKAQIFFLYNFDVTYWGDNIDHEKINYRWKEKKDDDREFENTPVDAFNHAADAIRYGVFTHLSRIGYNMDKIIIK